MRGVRLRHGSFGLRMKRRAGRIAITSCALASSTLGLASQAADLTLGITSSPTFLTKPGKTRHILMMRFLTRLVMLCLAITGLARATSYWVGHDRVWREPADVQPSRVAIVFGAGVRNGLPTAMLYDRVASAADLYRAGKVRTLLLSGENAGAQHDETAVMRQTALQLGVPDHDILLDGAGLSTFETCLRARDAFDLRGENVILVTQAFHLDRALLLCNAVGVPAQGFSADRRAYAGVWFNNARELPATVKAMWDILTLWN